MIRPLLITFAIVAAIVGTAIAFTPVGLIDSIRDPQEIEILDGDTIKLNGRRIRLYGIDAPERGQHCRDQNAEPYACGTDSAYHLWEMLQHERLWCELIQVDRYNRELAICKTRSGDDIGAHQVRDGMAIAYTRYTNQYRHEQAEAKAAARGLWRGTFTEPETYRHQAEQKKP